MQHQPHYQPAAPDEGRQQPYTPYAQQPSASKPQRPRRRGRLARFMRGYLMMVGALTTLYALVMLLVSLFVEIGKWSPALPIG